MTKSYTQMMGSAAHSDGKLSLEISPDWMQGRTTFGGLSAAFCLETATRTIDHLPPLRSAMVSFIGPAGGPVTGEARVMRAGKSVTFVESDIIGEKGLATRTVFAFGGGRPSQFDKIFSQAPNQPGPDDLEPFIPEGLGPNFSQHFETRLAQGARPVTGSDKFDHFIWVRHRDRSADSVAALLAVADMPPPAILPMFSEFAPISSMTWMINLLTEKPETDEGWWLLQSRAENASGGYSSQDMLVWNRAGELVITGRQSVAIFA